MQPGASQRASRPCVSQRGLTPPLRRLSPRRWRRARHRAKITVTLPFSHGATVSAVAASQASSLRVVKKLSVASRGAIRLARQFGDALVCVRHRVDAKGKYRYTTVELLVERAPITPRVEAMVGVKIGPSERSLQQLVRAAGATWDYKSKLWRMPKRVAGILRLSSRVAQK